MKTKIFLVLFFLGFSSHAQEIIKPYKKSRLESKCKTLAGTTGIFQRKIDTQEIDPITTFDRSASFFPYSNLHYVHLRFDFDSLDVESSDTLSRIGKVFMSERYRESDYYDTFKKGKDYKKDVDGFFYYFKLYYDTESQEFRLNIYPDYVVNICRKGMHMNDRECNNKKVHEKSIVTLIQFDDYHSDDFIADNFKTAIPFRKHRLKSIRKEFIIENGSTNFRTFYNSQDVEYVESDDLYTTSLKMNGLQQLANFEKTIKVFRVNDKDTTNIKLELINSKNSGTEDFNNDINYYYEYSKYENLPTILGHTNYTQNQKFLALNYSLRPDDIYIPGKKNVFNYIQFDGSIKINTKLEECLRYPNYACIEELKKVYSDTLSNFLPLKISSLSSRLEDLTNSKSNAEGSLLLKKIKIQDNLNYIESEKLVIEKELEKTRSLLQEYLKPKNSKERNIAINEHDVLLTVNQNTINLNLPFSSLPYNDSLHYLINQRKRELKLLTDLKSLKINNLDSTLSERLTSLGTFKIKPSQSNLEFVGTIAKSITDSIKTYSDTLMKTSYFYFLKDSLGLSKEQLDTLRPFSMASTHSDLDPLIRYFKNQNPLGENFRYKNLDTLVAQLNHFTDTLYYTIDTLALFNIRFLNAIAIQKKSIKRIEEEIEEIKNDYEAAIEQNLKSLARGLQPIDIFLKKHPFVKDTLLSNPFNKKIIESNNAIEYLSNDIENHKKDTLKLHHEIKDLVEDISSCLDSIYLSLKKNNYYLKIKKDLDSSKVSTSGYFIYLDSSLARDYQKKTKDNFFFHLLVTPFFVRRNLPLIPKYDNTTFLKGRIAEIYEPFSFNKQLVKRHYRFDSKYTKGWKKNLRKSLEEELAAVQDTSYQTIKIQQKDNLKDWNDSIADYTNLKYDSKIKLLSLNYNDKDYYYLRVPESFVLKLQDFNFLYSRRLFGFGHSNRPRKRELYKKYAETNY